MNDPGANWGQATGWYEPLNEGDANVFEYGAGASAPHTFQRAEGELRIHNVLALATLEMDRKVELDQIIPLFVNASFVPEWFPAVRVEVRGPITRATYTVSIFEGGRIQSAGGCMPREAGMCMKKVARRLRSGLNVAIKFSNFEIHNLLGVVDIGCDISLPKLFQLGPGQKDYEPEKFPALRVSLPVPVPAALVTAAEPSPVTSRFANTTKERRAAARSVQDKKKRKVETITASIFSNGKINFVGGKSVRSIVAIIDELRPFIEACSAALFIDDIKLGKTSAQKHRT